MLLVKGHPCFPIQKVITANAWGFLSWLINWLVDWLVNWLVGYWLVCWLVGWLSMQNLPM